MARGNIIRISRLIDKRNFQLFKKAALREAQAPQDGLNDGPSRKQEGPLSVSPPAGTICQRFRLAGVQACSSQQRTVKAPASFARRALRRRARGLAFSYSLRKLTAMVARYSSAPASTAARSPFA